MQLFPRLMLDSARIALQTLNVTFKQVVFVLQGLQLLVERCTIPALLLICSQAVLSKDYVVTEPEHHCDGNAGSDLAANHIKALIELSEVRSGLPRASQHNLSTNSGSRVVKNKGGCLAKRNQLDI